MDHNNIQPTQSLWSSALLVALLTGTVIFVLQRMFEKSFLDPIVQFNQNIGRLKSKISFYANLIGNPIVREEASDRILDNYYKCSDEIRTVWAEIDASYMVINRMFVFRLPVIRTIIRSIFRLPKEENFNRAMSCMISISNGIIVHNKEARDYYQTNNLSDLNTIKTSLGI